MMNAARRGRLGFTLIEILLVIAIIGVLASVLIFAIGGTKDKADKDATKVLLQTVCGALERYKVHVQHYPTEEEGGLQGLRTKPNFTNEADGEKWAGPYVESDPVDPWGSPLNYEVMAPGSEEAKTMGYKVWSNGPNKQNDNGADDDIRNKTWDEAEKKTGT
jgi:general secretion pathway protein G